MPEKPSMIIAAGALQLRQNSREFEQCRDIMLRYGHELTQEQYRELADRRQQALIETGRIELGSGIILPLLRCFSGSPQLTQNDCSDTLAELQDSFYRLKNHGGDLLPDDPLLQLMRRFFDGAAQGSVQHTEELCTEELNRLNNR